jgi:PASTA domain-containing protein
MSSSTIGARTRRSLARGTGLAALALLSVLLVAPAAAVAMTPEEAAQHVDVWIAASDSPLIGPAKDIASILALFPAASRGPIVLVAQQRMREIELQLDRKDLTDDARQRLEDASNRCQAIQSALATNDFTRITEIQKQDEARRAARAQAQATPPAGPTRDDERQNMEQMLGSYTKRLNNALKRLNDLADEVDRLAQEAEFQEGQLNDARAQREQAMKDDAAARSELKLLCETVTDARRRALAYGVACAEGEREVEQQIATTRARAGACKTVADADAVESGFHDAKVRGARMQKDGETARVARDVAADALKRVADISAPRPPKISYFPIMGQAPSNTPDEITTRLATVTNEGEQAVAGLQTALDGFDAASDVVDAVMNDVKDARKYYAAPGRFPEAAAKFDALLQEGQKRPILHGSKFLTKSERSRFLDSIRWDRNMGPIQVDVLRQPLPTCGDLQEADQLLAKSDEALGRALLDLSANEDVLAKAAECRRLAAMPPPPPPSPPRPAPTGPTPPGPSGPAVVTPPVPPPSVGGLFVRGPGQLVKGSNAQYVAVDAAGNPYPGAVIWAVTREDLAIIGYGSGLMVGNKPGTVVVIARSGDDAGELGVKIMAVVPYVVGFSLDSATSAIAAAGLTPSAPSVGGPAPAGQEPGRVQSTSPSADAVVEPGSPVSITVFATASTGGSSSTGGPAPGSQATATDQVDCSKVSGSSPRLVDISGRKVTVCLCPDGSLPDDQGCRSEQQRRADLPSPEAIRRLKEDAATAATATTAGGTPTTFTTTETTTTGGTSTTPGETVGVGGTPGGPLIPTIPRVGQPGASSEGSRDGQKERAAPQTDGSASTPPQTTTPKPSPPAVAQGPQAPTTPTPKPPTGPAPTAPTPTPSTPVTPPTSTTPGKTALDYPPSEEQKSALRTPLIQHRDKWYLQCNRASWSGPTSSISIKEADKCWRHADALFNTLNKKISTARTVRDLPNIGPLLQCTDQWFDRRVKDKTYSSAGFSCF